MCRFVPTRRNIKSWKLEKEIKKSLVKLIERRRETSEKVVEKGAKDLLGLMIEASNTNSTNVTVDDIVEECKSFFFAGKQTTSNLLTWTTILLAMHPQWQVRAREEVLKMCGSRDLPTKDHVAKLRTVSKWECYYRCYYLDTQMQKNLPLSVSPSQGNICANNRQ